MLMETERLRENAALCVLSDAPWQPDPPPSDWYVLLVEPQQEVKLYTYLKSYQCDVYLPMVPSITTRGARRIKVTVYRPMMRGYLFLNALSITKAGLAIKRSQAALRFMRFGERFATVPSRQIDRVKHIEAELAKPKPVQSIWSVGELVRVNGETPFCGLNVTVTDLANGDRIVVEVAMFGRAVPTTLDSALLEKL